MQLPQGEKQVANNSRHCNHRFCNQAVKRVQSYDCTLFDRIRF